MADAQQQQQAASLKRKADEITPAEQQEDGSASTKTGAEDEDQQASKKQKREPKRKIALVFGYNGSKYSGLQLQVGTKTIEEDLWAAIVKSGAVSKENASALSKVAWQRSSRTDKGVHAAINVVALKMIIEDPEIVAKINGNLPADIRVYGFHRVTTSFNPRTYCEARRYEYLLPSYAFKKRLPVTIPIPDNIFNEEVTTLGKLPLIKEEALVAQNCFDLSYRISKEDIARINEILTKFVGNFCFMNFTHLEKNAHVSGLFRKIFEFKVAETRMIEGVEFLVLTVHGAAFMIYQIRKMIGFLLAVFQGHYELSIFDKALSKTTRMSVPTAPSNGLLLDNMYYTNYNANPHTEQYGGLDRSKFATSIDQMKDQLYKFIANEEKTQQPCARWMYILPYVIARQNGVHIPSKSVSGNVCDELQDGDEVAGTLEDDG